MACGASWCCASRERGGEILVADVLHDGVPVERHAWNRLAGGVEVDLTREQFRRGETLGPAELRERIAASRPRYPLLRAAVLARLGLTRP